MKKLFLFYFLFFSSNFFCLEKELFENYGKIKVEISLSEEEINLLKKGIQTKDFKYLEGPEKFAITFNSFYLAIPENFDFNFKEDYEEVEGILPLLSPDGNLIYKDCNLPDVWYPEKAVKVLKKGFIRQVPFAIIHFYPIQISKKGLKINKKVEINFSFDQKKLKEVKENEIFERVYDGIFLNKWKDKGIEVKEKEINFWSVPPSNFTIYKIAVSKDGIYALTYEYLAQHTDWNLSLIDPRKIHLYNSGFEVPIYIKGESDGSFDPEDSIYFYGEYYKNENLEGVYQKGDFTDKNIYWLVVGQTDGLRMQTKDVSPLNGYNLLQNYEHKIHFEEENFDYSFVPSEDDDHWRWDYASCGTYDCSHNIAHHLLFLPAVSSQNYNCTLKYNIIGISHKQQNPDHHFKIKINSFEIEEEYFDGFTFFEKEISFPQSYLGSSGDLTVDLNLEVLDPSLIGVDQDWIQTNFFEIKYLRDFISYQNEIFFSIPQGNHKIQISNFSSNDIILLEIQNPENPKFCINFQKNSGTIIFEDSVSDQKRDFVAQIPLEPFEIIPFEESNLTEGNPEFIIILPKIWGNSSVLNNYVSYKQSTGIETKIVFVEEIYDYFNYGILSPFAIKNYLNYMYQKLNPPSLTYVLIIGDADYDFKNYLNNGNYNFVPTYIRSTEGPYVQNINNWAFFSYENFFVNFYGEDNLPEVLLGRIPAKNLSEMEIALEKTLYFETSLSDKNYLKYLFHISSCRDGEAFKNAHLLNSSKIIAPFEVENMFLTDPPYNQSPPSCTNINFDLNSNGITDVVDKMNSGKGIVNFIGHGAFTFWDDKIIFRSPQDVEKLTNQTKPSIVLNSNCFTSCFFHHSIPTSILEHLIIISSGAVSTFGPSSYMNLYQINYPIYPVYDAFFGPEKENVLGVLYYYGFAASEETGDEKLAQSMVVLGDPSIIYPLDIPDKPKNLRYIYSCRKITIQWDPPDSKNYLYNVYKKEENEESYKKIAENLNDLKFIDTNLIYGKKYYYRVSAINLQGFEGKWSSPLEAYAEPCPPLAPDNFHCEDKTWGGRIVFEWAPSEEPEIIKYRIYYGFSPGNYPYYVDTQNVSSFEIGGFADGVPVFSRISSFNYFNLESDKSSEISCTPTHSNAWKAPEMVYPITLTKDGSNPVIIFYLPSKNIWGDTILPSDIDFCTIYRSESPNFNPDRSSSSPDKIGVVYSSSCKDSRCRFKDQNSPQNAYYYVTCQTHQKEESSISINPPLYITNLEITYGYSGEANLSWEPVSKKIDGTPAKILYYEIYKDTNPNFLPDLKDKSNRAGISYTNQFIDPMSIGYYYKVVAVDTKGNGGPY